MYKTLLSYLILLFALPCTSLSIDLDNVVTDSVLVSAKRIPEVYSQTSRIVSIITKDEIRNAPVHTVQGLLEHTASVDVRQRGADGSQAEISLRGGSFEQTLILLNGVPINDPQTGHHNMNLPIDIEAIDRIEILEGPGSRLFGANAFAGAVNIITGERKKNSVRVSGSAAEDNSYKMSVSANGKLDNWNNFLSVSKIGTDGYYENTDMQSLNFFYQTSLLTQIGRFDAQAGHTDKSFGANSFYTPAYPEQFEQTETTFASMKYAGGETVRYSALLFWRKHDDRFELFRTNPAAWYNGHNYHETQVYGGQINFSYESFLGTTSIGGEWKVDQINSNKLGIPTGDTVKVPGEPDGYFTKYDLTKNRSIFFEHDWKSDRFAVSAGAFFNWNSKYDWNVYPGIDMSYKLNDEFKLIASVNKSVRMPSYTDLYYVGPTNLGNINLIPEESLTYEIGVKYLSKGIDAHLSVFRREGTNIIDWVKDSVPHKWESQNLTEINALGVTTGIKIKPKQLLGVDIFTDFLKINYTWLDMDKSSEFALSKYSMDNLKHNLSISAQHSIWEGLGINWSVIVHDRMGSFPVYENYKAVKDDVGNQIYQEFDPYALINLSLYYRWDSFRIYADVNNLTDQDYFDISNVVLPGRKFRVGFSAELK
ncbi:MAG: TonB-dependent receptor [Chlorobi bacterium]|nr:TonB-dependent receptor [Chlorobiota bacterium]